MAGILEGLAHRFVADGTVQDLDAGHRKAMALARAASVLVDAAMRIEVDRVQSEMRDIATITHA